MASPAARRPNTKQAPAQRSILGYFTSLLSPRTKAGFRNREGGDPFQPPGSRASVQWKGSALVEIRSLSIGEKVTLIHRGRSYSSIVQDLPEPDTLIIAQPSSRGVYLDIIEPDEAEILFHKENGILTFQVVQEARFVQNDVRMLKLRAVSAVIRSQRRSFFRLDKSLPIQVTLKGDEELGEDDYTFNARTLNISGGGCRIAIKQKLSRNAKLECRIALDSGYTLALGGKVVWEEHPANGNDKTNIIGVQFDDNDPAVVKQLVGFVTGEQRRQLNKNR